MSRRVISASLWALTGLTYPVASAAAMTRFQDTGELRGVVVDAKTDNPLAGIEVSFVQIDFSARTDSLGRYAITNIPPGRYTLLVKGDGFKPALASRHMLLAATVNVLDFALEPLAVVAPEPDEPEDKVTPTYWAQVIPGSLLRPNVDLVQALQGSASGVRFQQVTPVSGGSRGGPPASGLAAKEEFLWVMDGRAVDRARVVSVNTSDVTCVEIRRGAGAVQRFARTIPANRDGVGYQGVILVWTQGSRTPMPEACGQP